MSLRDRNEIIKRRGRWYVHVSIEGNSVSIKAKQSFFLTLFQWLTIRLWKGKAPRWYIEMEYPCIRDNRLETLLLLNIYQIIQ